jgi:multisubunit Na+/H+ antiporter MnhF subunit
MEMTMISIIIIGAALFIALVFYRIVRGSDLKKK